MLKFKYALPVLNFQHFHVNQHVMFQRPMAMSRCSRDATEMQQRCDRNAAEVRQRYGRDATEVRQSAARPGNKTARRGAAMFHVGVRGQEGRRAEG